MLFTSKVEKEIRDDINYNGYNYVSQDMKMQLLKDAVSNSMASYLKIENRGNYSLSDLVMVMDVKTRLERTSREIFSSYINGILNIASEIQGSVISWRQNDEEKPGFKYDEYGFAKDFVSPKNEKTSMVMLDLINGLENRDVQKLLVK